MKFPPCATAAVLLVSLSGCGGGGGGFRRPDYAADARARCDEAEAASDPNRALALYGMALEADPKMARAFYGRAVILDRRGQLREAERSYTLAVEYAQDDVKSRCLLGRARFLWSQRRVEDAVRDLDKAVALLSAFPIADVEAEVRLMRAECRVRLFDWAGAGEDLDAADKAGLNEAQRARARPMKLKVDAMKSEDRR